MTAGRYQFLRLLIIGGLAGSFGIFGLGLVALLSAVQFPQMLPIGLAATIGGAAAHFYAISRLDRLRRARGRGLSKDDLAAQVRAYAAGRVGPVSVAEVARALGLTRPMTMRVLRDLAARGECAVAERDGEPVFRFAAERGPVALQERLAGRLLSWAGALGDGAIAAASERSRELTIDVLAHDAGRFARRRGGTITAAELAAELRIGGPIAVRTLETLVQRGQCRRLEGPGEARYVFRTGIGGRGAEGD